mmetsp:Transcript_17844/g.12802  ORF Transcript_17844/g.12802 Transcript_17844/m.12802 type:complete len:96 (+) Transcript_17844:33-320(+)
MVASNFKTPVRAILYLQDSLLKFSSHYPEELNGPNKASVIKVSEISFVGKNFSLSILNNSASPYKDYLNQALLYDSKVSLDSLSGWSLLDQMGFA